MIGIIIFIVFCFLVGKSLLETAWGLCLIAAGIFWHIVGRFLDVLIYLERRRKTAALCVVGICAATAISYAQTSAAPTVAAATAENVMPVGRTLTSADGRTINVVITAKTATGIKAKKADGKEFEITLDTLSDADKIFVAGLVAAPIKKPTVLVIGKFTKLTTRMEKAGFDITEVASHKDLASMSDQKLESFDAIVTTADGPQPNESSPIQSERLLKLTSDEKIIAWRHYYRTDKREFIKKKVAPRLLKGRVDLKDQEPFINIQGNAIFYSWTKSNDKTGGEIPDDEILDQLVAELKRLIQQGALVQKLPK